MRRDEAFDRAADRPTELALNECLAFGCTLPGSMSSSTTGSSQWYCRHHFGRSTSEFDAISRAIHRGDYDDPPGRSPVVEETLTKVIRAPRRQA